MVTQVPSKSLASFTKDFHFIFWDWSICSISSTLFIPMNVLASILLSILLFFSFLLHAQKEDNTWLLGGNYSSPDSAYKACSITFSGNTPSVSFIDQGLPYRFTNCSISDSSGLFLCYSNGKHLYAKDFTIIAVSYTHLTLPTNREV